MEWSIVRQSLLGERGKPRRFSNAFISEERKELSLYREIFRVILIYMQHKNFIPDVNSDLSMLEYEKREGFKEEKVREVLAMIREY
jgi:hypothetical protein